MNPPDVYRPEPLLETDTPWVDSFTPPEQAAALLLEGEPLLITDRYQTGAEILDWLAALMPAPPPQAPFAARRAHAAALRKASLRLLAPIVGHRPKLEGFAEIGFLAELYPELKTFYLPFLVLQELRGAWVRYVEGEKLSVLGVRLHPFFGVYMPTRAEHLELFGTWLSRYPGLKQNAVDVGTGCGVLALMLARAGFSEVLAVDINPNAVESLNRELSRRPAPVTASVGDLLADVPGPLELIVFNPPWIPGTVETPFDAALRYSSGLFERFFEQAVTRMAPQGRLVMIFSNVSELLRPDVAHPIEMELSRGRLRLVDKLHRKIKSADRRRRTRERVEVWELALVGDDG
ncbi:MAG: methyltransferase [Myxococcota bacterium]